MKAELDKAWEERARARRAAHKDCTHCAYSKTVADEGGFMYEEIENKAWANEVYRIAGSVSMEWPGDGSCIVAGVMVFLPIKGD